MYELATTIMRDRLREAERYRLGRSVPPPRRSLRGRLATNLLRLARALAPELPELAGTWPPGHHGAASDPRAVALGR